MDASARGQLINRLADLIERDQVYLAVNKYILYFFLLVHILLFNCLFKL